MTYLERILSLIGELMEVSQYALKNAYRVKCLYETGKIMTLYTKGSELLIQAESLALKEMEEDEFSGSVTVLEKLQDKGISQKDYKTLSKVLKKKDYVATFFFLDKGEGFAAEDVYSYEAAIKELREDIERAKDLNLSLSRTADDLSSSYTE